MHYDGTQVLEEAPGGSEMVARVEKANSEMSSLIIAEIGVNNNGDMERAKYLIQCAHDCGAQIAKFQLYDVATLFPDGEIMAQGRNWYNEVLKTQLSRGQVWELAAHCDKVVVEFMASAYDIERLSWLEEIGVKRHKVATRMNQDKVFVQAVVSTGKPMLLSCLANYYIFTPLPIDRVKFLYCIPKYPTSLTDLHFDKVDFTRMGFSDHTIGIEAAMIALSRGAQVIEKHFTLDKHDMREPDHICSAEPQELRELVDFAKKVKVVLG